MREERGERAVSEDVRRDAVHAHPGHVHQGQAPAGHLPAGDVSAVRQPEAVLPLQLALLPGHVSEQPEEQGPQDVARGTR